MRPVFGVHIRIIFFLIGSFFTLFCGNDGSFELFSNEFLYCVGMEKVRNLFICRVVLIFFASSKDLTARGSSSFPRKALFLNIHSAAHDIVHGNERQGLHHPDCGVAELLPVL